MSSKTLKIALSGNPNSGKTTLFNALTGLKQKVGNYPGITVEKKTGKAMLSEKVLAENCGGGCGLALVGLQGGERR